MVGSRKPLSVYPLHPQSYIKLKFYMNIALALLVGSLYFGMGTSASKALFNFGFMFTIVIAYLYLPMMPVLLYCK